MQDDPYDEQNIKILILALFLWHCCFWLPMAPQGTADSQPPMKIK